MLFETETNKRQRSSYNKSNEKYGRTDLRGMGGLKGRRPLVLRPHGHAANAIFDLFYSSNCNQESQLNTVLAPANSLLSSYRFAGE